jgi:hypothetical protein
MKKRLTKNNKIQRINKKKLTKKGVGELSLNIFNNITNKNIIFDQLQKVSSNRFNNNNKIQSIRNTYSIKDHLYDFIFDLKTKKLIKIWDHEIGKPDTITAGVPGIHIYATLEPNERLVKNIIGTFVR